MRVIYSSWIMILFCGLFALCPITGFVHGYHSKQMLYAAEKDKKVSEGKADAKGKQQQEQESGEEELFN
mgnify:CR=1 FL=1